MERNRIFVSPLMIGGAIMPPPMIMDRNTPAAAMLDMAAVDPRDVVATYGVDARGDRDLTPRIENGVKIFELETAVIRWSILPGVTVDAYAFNGQIPGPRLRFRQGDRIRINVTNHLPETTTAHWHGLVLPNIIDGPARITQEPIDKGSLYRYEVTAVQSGTYLYHSHDHVDRQQALRLLRGSDHRACCCGREPRSGSRVHGAAAGMAAARGSHVSGDADGRRPTKLLHDQRASLPCDGHNPHACGRNAEGALRRLKQRLHPPDAHPRRPV